MDAENRKRKILRTSLPSSLHHRRCFAKRTLDELQGTETADLTRQKGKKLQKTHIWGQEQEKGKGKIPANTNASIQYNTLLSR